MADWLSSMQQTFEYYTVDPGTWNDVKLLDKVLDSSITRDSDTETLCSANIDTYESVNECYVRTYLVTVQNGVREKHPLATTLVQSPTSNFDGKTRKVTMDAYSPLLELKENSPPIGYHIPKGENIMDVAYRLVREHARAPVVPAKCDITLSYDFVADVSDTWLSFLTDLIASAKYKFDLDERGRILFVPDQDTASLQPIWTYDDSNSSILYPELDVEHDLYGIPNVVEVIYSNGVDYFYAKAVNDDPNSPTSTVSRGREIVHRDTEPSLVGNSSQAQIEEYAKQLLQALSTLEYTVTYKHGYCPVRLGDCVRLSYAKAGLNNVKARVISQQIECKPGCMVTEKAVFTNKLWG